MSSPPSKATHPTDASALWRKLAWFARSGRPFAVAIVLRSDGSTPLPAGARALIEPDGTIHGTVGGGAVEAEAIRLSGEVLRSGRAAVFDFDLRGPGPPEPAPICGGAMRLLVVPGTASAAAEYEKAARALEERRSGLWLSLITHASPVPTVAGQFLTPDDIANFSGPPSATLLQECLARERPLHLAPAGQPAMEVFIEPLLPRPRLLIVGGGHVGQAVAVQADWLGFETVVIEDRPEFANPALFPAGTQTRCGPIAGEVAAFPLQKDTFVVIVTRGHQMDAAALRACIRRPAAYIGMIGSRRKIPLLRRQFLENGWATPEEFARIYAPIGLDIGAVTVQEIAVSIMAQIIAVRRRQSATRIPLE